MARQFEVQKLVQYFKKNNTSNTTINSKTHKAGDLTNRHNFVEQQNEPELNEGESSNTNEEQTNVNGPIISKKDTLNKQLFPEAPSVGYKFDDGQQIHAYKGGNPKKKESWKVTPKLNINQPTWM